MFNFECEEDTTVLAHIITIGERLSVAHNILDAYRKRLKFAEWFAATKLTLSEGIQSLEPTRSILLPCHSGNHKNQL